MKTRTCILTLMILLGNIIGLEVNAQDQKELLTKANTLYNESAYDSAAIIYESIISKGYSSATLYYNLGNTYYKMGDFPMAILYYEKTLKLEPNNEDAEHNLEIAKAFISDKIESVPELFIKIWWNNLSNLFSANTWAVISLIVTGLLLTSMFIYLTTRRRIFKKTMFFASAVLIVFAIFTFSITSKKNRYIKNQDEGIIISPTITVKSSPSSTSVDLFVLHEGTKVSILDNTDNWDKIKIDNGSTGWLPSSTVIRY